MDNDSDMSRYFGEIADGRVDRAKKEILNNLYSLVCEDASHLGGPMGTEYTTSIFHKVFRSIDSAKNYAEKHYWRPNTKWDFHKGDNSWSADAGAYIYKIHKISVEE